MKELSNKILKYSFTLVILSLSVYYATKGIDFQLLQKSLMSVNYYIALAPIPFILASHWLRALRWKTMLEPIKHIKSTMNLFSAVMIGYAANSVLPIPRAGELLRPYVFSKREGMSFSSVFATIIVERILDLIFLMLLFGFSFVALRHTIIKILPQDINPNTLIFTAVLLIFVFLVSFYPPFFHFMLKVTVKPISEKVYNKLTELFEKFKKGVEIIKSPSAYFRLIVESTLIWIMYALPLWITFYAFDFQSTLHLGLVDAIMLVIVSGVGVTIAPTPGAIGVYHALVSTAMMQLYGIPKETGLAFATIVHAVSFLIQVIVGGLFFLREDITDLTKISSLKMED